MPFERDTERLRLRRPQPEDLSGFIALHSDPRTYEHAPASMPDELECRRRFDSYLLDWEEFGFGYLAVDELSTARLVGWGGVRLTAEPRTLNLYYRLAYDALGRGLGGELARAIMAGVREELPDHTVTATIARGNLPSLSTARAVGLVEFGEKRQPDGDPDEPPSLVLELRPAD